MSMRRVRAAVSAIGTAVAAALAAGTVLAQSASGPKRPANQAEEITLALSALPEPMRAGATVYTLGPKGYVKAREGTSGVNCLVERSRPDTQEPICWDREGSETIMPLTLARAEWRAAGASEAEIERRAGEGFAKGQFRAPRKAGVSYMLSAENYVFNGQRVVKYHPHVMIYAPYVRNADIGTTPGDPNAPWVLNEGSPHAYIIVVTRH
jgi:hypothetical protein